MILDNVREKEFPDDPLECKFCKFAGENPERNLKCPKHNMASNTE